MPTEEEEKSKRKTDSKWNKVRELFRGVSFKDYDPADCVRVKMIHDAYLEEVARSIQTDEDGQEYKMLRMTPEQLESHKLINKNGVLYLHINRPFVGEFDKIASTMMLESKNKINHQAFIIAKDGSFYIGNHNGKLFPDRKNFSHASFLGGRPAELAGTVVISDEGKIIKITDESGHYQPDKLDMYRGIKRLQREMPGVFSNHCMVEIYNENSVSLSSFLDTMEAIDPQTQKPLHKILRQKRIDDRQKEVAYLKSDFPSRGYFEKIIDSFDISPDKQLFSDLFFQRVSPSSSRSKLELLMQARRELKNPSAPLQLLMDRLKENGKLEEFAQMSVLSSPNPMLFALEKWNFVALDVMIENGYNINYKINGVPMIHYVPNVALLEAMMSRGADINAVDALGNTLIHNDVLYPTSVRFDMKYLRDHGANIDAVNSSGQTPLIIAVDSYNQCTSKNDSISKMNAMNLKRKIKILIDLGAEVSELKENPVVKEILEENTLRKASMIGKPLASSIAKTKSTSPYHNKNNNCVYSGKD